MYLLCVATLGLLAFSGVCHASSSDGSTASAVPTTEPTTQIVVTTTQTVVTTSQPKPTGVSYVVTDANSVVCILLNSTIKFSLPYKSGDGFLHSDFYLPSGGSTSGSSCNTTVANTVGQLLKVTNFYGDWVFSLFFERSGSSFAATKLMLNYKVTASPLFPNATGGEYSVEATYNGTFQSPLFASASIPGYLICNSESKKSLVSTLNSTSDVAFKELTVFAFGAQNSTALTGSRTQCSGDAPAPDYLVPIIVGCALAGIILIVLIAYIIGRYRSRSTYQTV